MAGRGNLLGHRWIRETNQKPDGPVEQPTGPSGFPWELFKPRCCGADIRGH